MRRYPNAPLFDTASGGDQVPTLGVSTPSLPRVMVLLATYNGAQFIEEQLRSLATQTGVQLEVLASDDGSSDDTVDTARRTASDAGLHFEFLATRPPSGSSASNFFRLLRDGEFNDCDYVALCDQDDIWLDGKMHRATSMLENFPEAGYSCNSIAFWPDGAEKRIRKNFPQKRWDYLFESASHGCTYVLTATLARRFQSFLRQCPTDLNSIQFHDMLIYAFARTNGIPWIMDDPHLIRYRQSTNNVLGANSGITAAVLRWQKLKGGWLRRQSLAIIDALDIAELPIARSLRRYRLADRLKLAARARQCRRRSRDALVFGVACLVFAAADQ